MWAKISNTFFKGLIVLLPTLITIWLVSFLFSFMDGILGGPITIAFGRPLPGLGFFLTVSLIFITGYFANYIIWEKSFRIFEKVMSKVPIVKGIYSSAKQINDVLFLSGEQKGFRKACLIQYPSQGIYTLGFVTTVAAQEIQQRIAKDKVLCIFVPNTPTPATGFLVMIPAKEVLLLDMKTEDAFKLVVSGGVLKPPELKA